MMLYRNTAFTVDGIIVDQTRAEGIYGAPPADLADRPEAAIQFSPLMPGSQSLEAQGDGSLASMLVLAPPGTIERRYVIAHSLRALAPGGRLVVLAPKDKGGSRLGKELATFGCAVSETARRHHRICIVTRPDSPLGIAEAMAEGSPRFLDELGLWSQPGIFSWNRVDPGSALLAQHLTPLSGRGADLGCGIGYLSGPILRSSEVQHLTLIDIDRRAVEAARRNVQDPRVDIRWSDVRESDPRLAALNFVVMNPPFHDGGAEDRALGVSFIRRAADMLRIGGSCWLVANRHLPYEAELKPLFKRVVVITEVGGYKIFEGRK
jgi:16S rRNA (guanine1207-N2)-methyltransferase